MTFYLNWWDRFKKLTTSQGLFPTIIMSFSSMRHCETHSRTHWLKKVSFSSCMYSNPANITFWVPHGSKVGYFEQLSRSHMGSLHGGLDPSYFDQGPWKAPTWASPTGSHAGLQRDKLWAPANINSWAPYSSIWVQCGLLSGFFSFLSFLFVLLQRGLGCYLNVSWASSRLL